MGKPVRLVFAVIAATMLYAAAAEAPSSESMMSEEAYAAAKEAMLRRPRRVMHNNDGCDVTHYPVDKLPVTVEKFLAQRITCTAGIVDTIVYCPISSGFGQFTVELPGFDVLRSDPPAAGYKQAPPEERKYHNIVDDLAALGTDAVREVLDFAHAHGQEFFWGFRTNDTHDVHYTEENDLAFFNPWKRAHREFLFGGAPGKGFPNGSWSCVDFTFPEVRERQVEMVRQILKKYGDIDGFEFDFSRYPPMFRTTALGGYASQEERDVLTQMYREIRALVDEAGRKRGRPYLIAMQLHDSIDYCRGLGIDLELWLKEGLLDIWILPDCSRLDTFANDAALAHKYGRLFYPQMGYPYPYEREEKGTKLSRSNDFCSYYARALAALASGADGLHYANITAPGWVRGLMKTDLDWLRKQDKRYFVTDILWEALNGALASGERWTKLPQLIARKPRWITPGIPQQFTIEIGDDLPALAASGNPPEVCGWLDLGQPEMQGRMRIESNGIAWERVPEESEGRYEKFRIPVGALKQGANTLTLSAATPPANETEPVGPWSLTEDDGISVKANFFRHPYDSRNPKAFAKTAEGWRITDTGESDDDIANAMLYFLHRAGAFVFDFEARLVASDDPMAAVARMADGRNLELLQLLDGKVRLHYGGFEMPLNTSDFHRYRIVFYPDRMTFSVDGKEVFHTNELTRCDLPENAIQGWKHADHRQNTSSLFIGSFSGKGSGVSDWRHITVGSLPGSVWLNNLAVEVNF